MSPLKHSAIILVIILAISLAPALTSSNSTWNITTQIASTDRLLYVVIYYGWINTSTLLQAPPDILIAAGNNIALENRDIITELQNAGTKVYLYLHDGNTPIGLGSSYKNMVVDGGSSASDWVSYINSLVDRYDGIADGVFLDEVDPGYFTTDLTPSNPLIQDFENGLEQIVEYAHSLGLKVIVNGVRAYASYGDYYLWESWCSTYIGPSNNPTYTYVQDFFQSSPEDSNPLAWVNDIAKLNYLRDNNLLDKTLAISLGPTLDREREEICSISAAIAGFAGWGYADANYYASGTGPAPVYAYPIGVKLSTTVIDTIHNTMKAQFTTGEYIVEVSDVWTLVSVGDLYAPPSKTGASIPVTVGDAGSGLDITGLTILHDGFTIQLKINLDSGFQGNAIHVYIDSDLDETTGYNNYAKGIRGADMLIEYIPPSSPTIYTYGGDGTSWVWNRETGAYAKELGTGEYIITPLSTIDSLKLWVATLDTSWSIADVEPENGVTIYSEPRMVPLYSLRRAINTGHMNGIAVISSSTYTDSIIVYAPTGYYSEIMYYKPWKPTHVTQATVAGTEPIPYYDSITAWQTASGTGYCYEYNTSLDLYKICIRAGPHQSPITLDVEYETQPLGLSITLGRNSTISAPFPMVHHKCCHVLIASSIVVVYILVHRRIGNCK